MNLTWRLVAGEVLNALSHAAGNIPNFHDKLVVLIPPNMTGMSGKRKARKASFIAFGLVVLAALSCSAEPEVRVSFRHGRQELSVPSD